MYIVPHISLLNVLLDQIIGNLTLNLYDPQSDVTVMVKCNFFDCLMPNIDANVPAVLKDIKVYVNKTI